MKKTFDCFGILGKPYRYTTGKAVFPCVAMRNAPGVKTPTLNASSMRCVRSYAGMLWHLAGGTTVMRFRYSCLQNKFNFFSLCRHFLLSYGCFLSKNSLKIHSRRANTIKETFDWAGILGKPSEQVFFFSDMAIFS